MTNDFPLLSLGSRHPRDVFVLKRLAEVNRELDQRKRFYPAWVNQGRLSALEMEHELRIFAAIADDLAADHRLEETGVWAMPGSGDGPLDLHAVHEAWQTKVRALRRELAIRRAAYPKRIEQGRLSVEDAAKQLERMEAVHWQYWVQGFCIVVPGDDAAGRAASYAIVRAHIYLLHTGDQAEAASGLSAAQLAQWWHQTHDEARTCHQVRAAIPEAQQEAA